MGRRIEGSLRTKRLSDGHTAYQARIRGRAAVIGHSPYWNEAKARNLLDDVLVPAAKLGRDWWEMIARYDPAAAGLGAGTTDPAGPTFHEAAAEAQREKYSNCTNPRTRRAWWTPIEKHLLPFFAYKDPALTKPRLLAEVSRDLVTDFIDHKRAERDILRGLAADLATLEDWELRDHDHLAGLLGPERWLLLRRYGQVSKLGKYSLSSRGISDQEINRCLDRLREIVVVARLRHHRLSFNDPTIRQRIDGVTRGTFDRKWLFPRETEALLEAARRLDGRINRHGGPDYRDLDREGIITVLILAVPRISELCQLDWSHVYLSEGVFWLGKTKTKKGRMVHLVPAVRAVFERRLLQTGGKGLVWPTAKGTPRDKDNMRERIINPVVAEARRELAARGEYLPARVSAQTMRRTGVTYMAWAGWPARVAMAQAGQSTARMVLEVYQQPLPRDRVGKAKVRAWLGKWDAD
jgi:integrase